MNTKLTYQEILSALEAFTDSLSDTRIGWKLSLYVSRNIDFLRPHTNHYFKAREALIEEHSVEDTIKDIETGKERTRQIIPAETILQFRKEEQELLDTEIEIEYDSINFVSLDKKDQEKLDEFITPKILHNIKYTFKE